MDTELVNVVPIEKSNATASHHVEDHSLRDVAAIDDGASEKISLSTIVAIFFLGTSVVGPITCGQLLIGSILYQVGVALGDPARIGWVISGWAIASAVSFAVAGRLSDIFGRRWVILVGELFAIVGSIVCATTQNVSSWIAGSTLLGFSCGLILVIFAAVPELCPKKYRGYGIAWIEFCLFIPWGAFSTLIATALLQHTTWRWIYYVSIIYTTMSLVGTALFYFPPSRGEKDNELSRLDAMKKIDYLGLILFTGGLTTCLIGFAWAGTSGHPWKSASVVAPIIIGFVSLIVCFTYEWVVVADDVAFFPWSLFQQFRKFTVLLIVGFVSGMIYYPGNGLLPQATLFIFNNNPTRIGIIQLPNGLGQFFGSTVIPALLHLTKAPKFFIVSAVFLQTLFVGLYIYALPSHQGAWMAFQFFGQGCFDWVTTCSIVNASLHVRQADLGLAIGLLGTFRSFGGSIGNAIFQSILSGVLGNQLAPRIASAALKHGYSAADLTQLIPAVIGNAAGTPNAFAGVPNLTPGVQAAASQALKEAYAYAFSRVFYSALPFGIIALIASLFIEDAGKLMTSQVAVHMEKNVFERKPPHEKGEM